MQIKTSVGLATVVTTIESKKRKIVRVLYQFEGGPKFWVNHSTVEGGFFVAISTVKDDLVKTFKSLYPLTAYNVKDGYSEERGTPLIGCTEKECFVWP